jgi:hypothetical protein
MKSRLSKGLPHVYLVVLFSVAGFAITFFVLNANYKEYVKLPPQVTICTGDAAFCNTFAVKQPFVLQEKNLALQPKHINKKGFILFHYNPAFLIWTMLILLLITLCSGSFPVFWNIVFEIKKDCNVPLKEFIYTICFGLVIVLLMSLIPIGLRGYYTPYKIVTDLCILLERPFIIQGLIIATVILVFPVILTMFMVGTAGNVLIKRFETESEIKGAAEKFSQLHNYLLAALQVLAIVVVLTGFCSSGLRQSIKSIFELTGFDIFPVEMSYAYGLFYAMFLSLFYFPVYYSLKRNARDIKNHLFANTDGLTKEALKKRHMAVQRLETKTTAIESLKLALTIMSPLLTSFIPEYLHLFK